MLRKIFGFITNKSNKQHIKRDKHNISRKNISQSALKVLYRLKEHGYAAYLVGGGVRDLLLNLEPKDFDIVTDAKPEQIRDIFSNCRLIGRRFRLAHVFFGREIIEVATFRSSITDDSSNSHKRSDNGLILRDNVYGTLEEDCIRRDFTINALYYNIEDFSIVDFAGGYNDLKSKRIKIIGDASERYIEDPVRMLRVARFAAKLNFKVDKKTSKPIKEHAHLIAHVSSSRLHDDCLKLLLNGHSLKGFHILENYDLFDKLFYLTASSLKNDKTGEVRRFIELALTNTDKRIREKKPVIAAFIYSCLLWYPLLDKKEALLAEGMSSDVAFITSMDKVIAMQRKLISIPWRIVDTVKTIWFLQERLDKRNKRKLDSLLDDKKFRAGYDFLLLRAEVNSSYRSLSEWWTKYLEGDDKTRAKLKNSLSSRKPRRARNKPSKKSEEKKED